ncbi:MAG: hypothetical protein ACLP36_02645 [Acidimicrobiales bacterium]
MTRPRQARLIEAALRCYPTRWRERHGEEAIELARLLLNDGMPAVAVAWSYLRGAAREQAVRPGRRLGTTLAAVLAGVTLIGAPLVLLDSLSPAGAAPDNQIVVLISSHSDAAGQLESVFRSHHFDIDVEKAPSSPGQAGSILAVEPDVVASGEKSVLREITGACADGSSGCVDGIVLPLHYSGRAQVFVGAPAKPGETYFGSPSIFGPGERLQCSGLFGETLSKAWPTLRRLHVKIAWHIDGSSSATTATPSSSLHVVGGDVFSATSISIQVSSRQPANYGHAGSSGRRC